MRLRLGGPVIAVWHAGGQRRSPAAGAVLGAVLLPDASLGRGWQPVPARLVWPRAGLSQGVHPGTGGRWRSVSLWVRYVCNVNSSFCLVFPVVFC